MGTHQSLSRRGPILDAAAIPDDCKQPRHSSSPNEQLVSRRCAQLGPPSTMLTIASGARAFVDEARGHCDGYVSVVARRGVQFYIGIIENPQRRWEQHDIASPGMWSSMDVVLCAPCCAVTAALERYPSHRKPRTGHANKACEQKQSVMFCMPGLLFLGEWN